MTNERAKITFMNTLPKGIYKAVQAIGNRQE